MHVINGQSMIDDERKTARAAAAATAAAARTTKIILLLLIYLWMIYAEIYICHEFCPSGLHILSFTIYISLSQWKR